MKYFSISEKSWDVPIYFETQWVQLDRGYALRWFLTNVLNSYQVYDFDYPVLCLDEHCKFYLKELGEKCFDENKKFIVLDKMRSILEFYGVDKEPFKDFIAFEERASGLFNFINGLRKADLLIESAQAVQAMAVLIEKASRAENYEKVMRGALIKSVFHEGTLRQSS